MVTRLFTEIDNALFRFGPTTENLKEAITYKKDPADITESTFEAGSSVAFLSYNLLSIPHYLSKLGVSLISVSQFAMKHISTALILTNYIKGLGVLGCYSHGLSLIKEAISTGRQFYFFKTDLWKDIKSGNACFNDLKGKNVILLKRVMPDWLYNELKESPNDHILNNGQSLDMAVKSYVLKKSVLHILNMVIASIGIATSIGCIVGFAWPIAVALLGSLMIAMTIAYVYKNGVVENPYGGFSATRCLPAALLPKAILEKEEMKNDIKVSERMLSHYPRMDYLPYQCLKWKSYLH